MCSCVWHVCVFERQKKVQRESRSRRKRPCRGREVNRMCDIKAELGGCLKGERDPQEGTGQGVISESSQGK